MSKNKFHERLKSGVSVSEIESFAKKYTHEVFVVLALLISSISSAFHFFTGPGLALFLFTIAAIAGIFFSIQVDRILKQIHGFASKQEKTTQLVIGAVEIVVAIFVPFIILGFFGLLAGTSFHYYNRHAQVAQENRPNKQKFGGSGDDHD